MISPDINKTKKFISVNNLSWLTCSSFHALQQLNFSLLSTPAPCLVFKCYTIASCSCSPILLSSLTFCSMSTVLRAVPQPSCCSNLCLQQGRRSTLKFFSRFLRNILCKHRLTFHSRQANKTSFF